MSFVIDVPVDETLEVLGHGKKWVKGAWSNGDGLCLHGGIRQCVQHPGDAHLIQQVADRQGWGTGFNDADATTFDDVKQQLMAHREVLPAELEETFGPNWSAVVALVRQAAIITPEQAKQLHAAQDAGARIAGGFTFWNAQSAVWNARADRSPARDAAWDAAQRAASVAAASHATVDAALAVVVHDLIDGDTFTQQHYDTLVGPWASVFGDPMKATV